MLDFLRIGRGDDKLVAKTSLSSFVRDASSADKKQVYNRVISKATEDQKQVLLAVSKLKEKKAA